MWVGTCGYDTYPVLIKTADITKLEQHADISKQV